MSKSHARKKPLLAGYRSNAYRTESVAKKRYPTPLNYFDAYEV